MLLLNGHTFDASSSAGLRGAVRCELHLPICPGLSLLSPVAPAVGGGSEGQLSLSMQVLDSEGTIFATAQLVGSEQLPVRALQVCINDVQVPM
jgi:hypothetical protein